MTERIIDGGLHRSLAIARQMALIFCLFYALKTCLMFRFPGLRPHAAPRSKLTARALMQMINLEIGHIAHPS